jgi:hypothetical protein
MRFSRVVLVAVAASAAALAGAAASSGNTQAGAGPIATAKPSIAGTIAVGRRVTALTGTWSGTGPIRYTFQWYRCDASGARCNAIQGATSATYTLVERDVAKTLALTVWASDTAGKTAAYASLVGPIARSTPLLVSTVQPLVAGLAVQGKAVQASTGVWSPTPTKVTYGWLRCNRNGRVCGRIANATGSSYTIGAADVGHALVALVQASFGTTAQTAYSVATTVAMPATTTGPTPVAGPTVGGTAAQGRQLTASPGTWSGVGPVSFAYQWYRCDTTGSTCLRISGATRETYTLGRRDLGKALGLTLRATDSSGTATAYAGLVGPIAPTPSVLISTAQPTIGGDPRRGQSLVVSPGTWSPAPASVTYAWQRCNAYGRLCVPIEGAVASVYAVTAEDSGHALLAIVTATSPGGSQAALSVPVVVP